MTSDSIDLLWEKLAVNIAASMRMTDDEFIKFRANSVARLVGLLPFMAGCDDPERTALSHLATFVIAGRGESRTTFDHAPADDIEPLARLRTISDFKGGDDATIERGMALLCLCMVSGYERDGARDAQSGEYNPVASGAWNAVSIKEQLAAVLARNTGTTMDLVMTADDTVRIFWEG